MAQVIGGQKDTGTHAVEWNGTDDFGDMLPDGSYTYEVIAIDDNYGRLPVETTMSGLVTGVTYEHGTAYLLLDDKLVDPATVMKVWTAE